MPYTQEQQMTVAPFQPGDRVRARIATLIVPVRTPGTVVQLYPLMHGAYEVRFDNRPAPNLMWEDELELADDTPSPEHTDR
jgi:hypothetical protein